MNMYPHSSYLTVVKRLDFGDGPGGAVYQHQLNVIVRFIGKNEPHFLDDIREAHDISHILTQIEREDRLEITAVKETRRAVKKESFSAHKIFRTTFKSRDQRETEAQEAGIRREDEGTSFLSRLFRK
ncbi:hypothetical protein HYPSUDRAFT_1045801 [Hypholoma sublateritium FD-334 SS-4]|uniref:Uncharacterized protein n=1 Tax=Hypholoma sublateritium (strain FD-334 SS-4) TaxID=945553 RepID=A0A0D2M1F7_HYPSF|nr:hypothetical protein HYPSUDRAFT_1045801 [Hypholoma sublateritium FD-334 SS-4]